MQLQLICGVEEHEVPAVKGAHAIVTLLLAYQSTGFSVRVSALVYRLHLLLFLRDCCAVLP
jgi:hypothetical protein